MSRRRPAVAATTTAALVVLLAAACDQPGRVYETRQESVTLRTEGDAGLDVDPQSESEEPVQYTSPRELIEREREITPRAEIPEDFPRDVPTYRGEPGSDVRVVASLSQAGRGQMVTLRSSDPPEQIFAYYKDELAEDGWVVESELERPRHRMLTTSKGDRQVSLSIITSEAGDFSQVMVRVTRAHD
ncbi:MAG: hypothetical protein O7A09_10570 [Proteobacteria bacterium]|nr:hypothetical protein [Pseudomonadota bacterium]